MAIYMARIVEEAYIFGEKASRLKVVGCRRAGGGWMARVLACTGGRSRGPGLCPRPVLCPMRGWRARWGWEGWLSPKAAQPEG